MKEIPGADVTWHSRTVFTMTPSKDIEADVGRERKEEAVRVSVYVSVYINIFKGWNGMERTEGDGRLRKKGKRNEKRQGVRCHLVGIKKLGPIDQI